MRMAVLWCLVLMSGGVSAEEKSPRGVEYLYWLGGQPENKGVICDTEQITDKTTNRYREPTFRFCDSEGLWVQLKWVQQGDAIFNGAALIPNQWIKLLLEAEQEARTKAVGGWKKYRIWPALLPDNIPTQSAFQIVEGIVRSVKVYKGVVYLNFGDDWRTDFTAAIPSQFKVRFKKENWNFDELVNMSIRARGFVRSYNGPYMEIEWPTQIEILPN